MNEWWIKWKPWLVFGVCILIWVTGIVIPFYPQILFDIPATDNPYIGIAGAVIGAGPFILHIIFQEYVDVPRFIVTTTNDEKGVEGVYFDKILLINGNNIYPIIEAVTTVKNVGRVSVSEAAVRVNLRCDDSSISEQEFYSRWTADLYSPSTDIHPGRERELVLFQIIPSQECIDELNVCFVEEQLEISIDGFFSLNWDRNQTPDYIAHLPGQLYLQRPLNPDSEEFEYQIGKVDQLDKRRFIGRNIVCPDAYEVSLYLTSEDWSGPIEVGTVPIDAHILKGNWLPTQDKYRPLREDLKTIGWESDEVTSN